MTRSLLSRLWLTRPEHLTTAFPATTSAGGTGVQLNIQGTALLQRCCKKENKNNKPLPCLTSRNNCAFFGLNSRDFSCCNAESLFPICHATSRCNRLHQDNTKKVNRTSRTENREDSSFVIRKTCSKVNAAYAGCKHLKQTGRNILKISTTN